MVDISHSAILSPQSSQLEIDEARAGGCLLVDVRSRQEFVAGTIPGAVNIPLFNEDERSVIGTIYKHGGHEQAIDTGFGIVREKLSELVALFDSYSGRKFAVFCARGGMRSLSVVNLLKQSGFEAYQIVGGYKKHRNEVMNTLENFEARLIVLHGLTGTGKTRILQKLTGAIDLEELARHRSSIFGGLDRDPSRQREFESGLAMSISSLDREPYFIEGESRKIGQVFMPKSLAIAMRNGILVNVQCSFATRVSRILQDYPIETEERRNQLEAILQSLRTKMGNDRVEEMVTLLRHEKHAELVHILLTDYYDRRYAKSMARYVFQHEISSEDIEMAARQLEDIRLLYLQ